MASGCRLLDFNESTLPPSPKVIQALTQFLNAGRLQVYPEYQALQQNIAEYAGVSAQNILFTNGSDQGIDILFRGIVGQGDRVLLLTPSFAMFEQAAHLEGAEIITHSYGADCSFPYEHVAATLGTGTIKLAVFVTPNNPTGTPVDLPFIRQMVDMHPQTFFIIDEAYFEFHGETSKDLVVTYSNMAVLRTFSKAFALAAVRLGYVIAHRDVIDELEKIRGPYDVNTLAVVAAQAALEDPAYMYQYRDEVIYLAKPRMLDFFTQRGIAVYAGKANFILFDPGNPQVAIDFLRTRGILVRRGRGAIAHMVRVTVGTTACVDAFIGAYSEYLEL
ncbi:pyridoxal phosphate-dependent aminotransferase [Chrysiogenes arsenatis]|uniref:pyridoxal phosphate-dependent aminotransferase n=1 Tax=Chrysiogenes arsenatis TaxID=309797 RepID=UPI0006866300|nr:histidinol-phosphate transaminase [Chrysiogenes arsenatis]